MGEINQRPVTAPQSPYERVYDELYYAGKSPGARRSNLSKEYLKLFAGTSVGVGAVQAATLLDRARVKSASIGCDVPIPSNERASRARAFTLGWYLAARAIIPDYNKILRRSMYSYGQSLPQFAGMDTASQERHMLQWSSSVDVYSETLPEHLQETIELSEVMTYGDIPNDVYDRHAHDVRLGFCLHCEEIRNRAAAFTSCAIPV